KAHLFDHFYLNRRDHQIGILLHCSIHVDCPLFADKLVCPANHHLFVVWKYQENVLEYFLDIDTSFLLEFLVDFCVSLNVQWVPCQRTLQPLPRLLPKSYLEVFFSIDPTLYSLSSIYSLHHDMSIQSVVYSSIYNIINMHTIILTVFSLL